MATSITVNGSKRRSKKNPKNTSAELVKKENSDVLDVDVDNVFCMTVISEKVKIPASRLDAKYATYVTEVLRAKYFNVCSRHGFVRDGYLKIISIASPIVQLSHLNGDSYSKVTFQAWVCNPSVNSHVRGTVAGVNKFGILVQAGPIKCVVTKNPVSSKLISSLPLDHVSMGDRVVFRVMGVNFEVGDGTISVVGTLEGDEDKLNREIAAIRNAAKDRADNRVTSVQDTLKKTSNKEMVKTVVIDGEQMENNSDDEKDANNPEEELDEDAEDEDAEDEDVDDELEEEVADKEDEEAIENEEEDDLMEEESIDEFGDDADYDDAESDA